MNENCPIVDHNNADPLLADSNNKDSLIVDQHHTDFMIVDPHDGPHDEDTIVF